MTLLQELSAKMFEATGWNFSILYDGYDAARFVRGLATTLLLSILSIAASVVLGFIGAYVVVMKTPLLGGLVIVLVKVFRNTPPLLQIYFLFFGMGPLFSQAFGVALSGFAWATIAISLYAAAFNVECFRAGLESVPTSTVEAAESLGYSPFQIFSYVTMPIGLRAALPALTNNLVELVKTTSYAYAVGVAEILYVASQIWTDQLNVTEMMIVLFCSYTTIIGALVVCMNALETRLRMPGYSR